MPTRSIQTGMSKKAKAIAEETGIAIGAIRKGRSKKPTALAGDKWGKVRAGCLHCGYYNELLWTDAMCQTRAETLDLALRTMIPAAVACDCEHLEAYLTEHSTPVMLEDLRKIQHLNRLAQE